MARAENPDYTPTVRLSSLKKEAGLLFLSVFYFIIATNTQTGWLFVLSAFLLGLLALSWVLSRRSVAGLTARQSFSGEPQRNSPMRLEVSLANQGPRTVQEVRVEAPCPNWAPESEPLRCAVPRLSPGQRVKFQHRLVPARRGEHSLAPLTIVSGAPFGLFTIRKTQNQSDTFLVYPEIERLPGLRFASRVATTMGELTSPKGKGDTRSLRSVRDYRPGDDLRQVHWKASAKRGPGMPLLVREHHAPAPSRIVVFLDSSGVDGETGDLLFERAVTLTSSLLWAAHREGTPSVFLHRDGNREWTLLRRWSKQYPALARVQPDPALDFEQWRLEANEAFRRLFSHGLSQVKPCLVKAASPQQETVEWPGWADRIYLLEDPKTPHRCPPQPGLIRLDGTGPGFQEVSLV